MDSIWPDSVILTPGSVQIGMRHARSYHVAAYPREVRPGWFEPLLAFSYPLTISFYTAPLDNGDVLHEINRRLIWHRGSHEARVSGGRLEAADAGTAIEDAERLRVGLARGDTRLLEVGLTLTVWADTPEELDQVSRLLESLAQGMLLVLRRLKFQQDYGLRRTLPLGEPMTESRQMDSQAWATLFPFSSPDVIHDQGQVMGLNQQSHSLVVVDRFQLASPHSIAVGWSGAGKSFQAKLEALRSRYRGLNVTILDPEGEYRALGGVGAQVWAVGQKGVGLPFDPLVIDGRGGPEEVERQADFMLRLLWRLSPDLREEYGPIVFDALWGLVRGRRGFLPPDQAMVDPERLLEGVRLGSVQAAGRLELALERFQLGAGDGGGPETVPPDDFEVFDLSRLSEAMKGVVYLALTEWISRRVGDGRRRLVIFDEAWHLLNDVDTAPYLEELFRRARKWGTALALMTQDISDFTRSRSAEVCLRNAPLIWLMRQHPESIQEVATLLRLHAGEVALLQSCGLGEGLLLVEEDHVPIRVVAAPRESQIISQGLPIGGYDDELV